MLKIDWLIVILLGMIISMMTEYWHGQHIFIWFEKFLLRKDLKRLYKFFYCRFCVIGKLSILAALLIRPADVMIIMPYGIWLVFVFFFNWILINFIALIIDGILMQFAMKNIFKRQDEEYKLLISGKNIVVDTEDFLMKKKYKSIKLVFGGDNKWILKEVDDE